MQNTEIKSYSLSEMKDKYIGEKELKTEKITNMNFVWMFWAE